MFFRIKTVGSHQYLQIVHSVREGKKVRQRVLGTLGRFDELKASGRLDALMRSGLRHCEDFAVIDAHKAGETKPVAVRRIWAGPGLRTALEGERHPGSFAIHTQGSALRVRCRTGHLSDCLLQEDRGRGELEPKVWSCIIFTERWLFWEIPLSSLKSRLVRFACTKDLIEESLFDSRRDLFTEVDLVFFDTTSLYFEGEGGQSIGKRGHNKDHRPDLKQMVVGIAVDVQGRPMCCEMWPGNTADVTTLVPIVQRMRERFRLREITVVADRGMVSKATLEVFEKSDPPVHYVIGVRMRRQKEVNLSVLDSCEPWFESVPERSNAKDPSPLKVKDVWVENRRYIVCLNEEERRKDAHDREAIVAHLKEQLRRGDKSLVGNKGYRRFLKVEGKDHFALDEEQIEADARYDGLWVLRTNTVYNAETVAHVYKNLWTVEAIFRTTKSILETRPIYHRWNETICGHVFCSFLALLLKHDLESRMRQAGMQWEWAEVIRGLDNLHQVEANFQGRSFLFRSQLQANASAAIRAAGVALPPTLREL